MMFTQKYFSKSMKNLKLFCIISTLSIYFKGYSQNTAEYYLNQGKINSCGHLRIHIEDLLGQRFDRLVIIESVKTRNTSNKVVWKARCDCGNEVVIAAGSLKRCNKILWLY